MTHEILAASFVLTALSFFFYQLAKEWDKEEIHYIIIFQGLMLITPIVTLWFINDALTTAAISSTPINTLFIALSFVYALFFLEKAPALFFLLLSKIWPSRFGYLKKASSSGG